MKIQIFADFVCPFCYAGRKKLMDAVNKINPSIEVEMMSYELSPGSTDNNDLKLSDVLEEKYGMSPEEVKESSKQTAKMIEEAGLDINSDKLKSSNTLKAHALLQYAKEKELANDLANAVYHAYFVEGAYLNKDEDLIKAASKVGFNEETVKKIIQSEKYIQKVHADQDLAKQIGITSVPHIIIDGKSTSLEGSHPPEKFEETIKQKLSS